MAVSRWAGEISMGSNMSSVPLPPMRIKDGFTLGGYAPEDMHAHAAAVSAALLESMASERHRAFLLAERVRVLEEALQSIEHDSKYFGPSELKRQAREALKGASHE
jgi:hypothetical protein